MDLEDKGWSGLSLDKMIAASFFEAESCRSH